MGIGRDSVNLIFFFSFSDKQYKPFLAVSAHKTNFVFFSWLCAQSCFLLKINFLKDVPSLSLITYQYYYITIVVLIDVFT